MKNESSIKYITVFAIAIIFFTIKGVILDPDFGWHIITGQYILQHGIPKTDPFSYAMPSYFILDHEWASDLILAILFPIVHMIGLAIIYAIMAISSLVLQMEKKKKWSSFIFLLSCVSLLLITGVKQQVISWLLFSVLIFIRRRKDIWKKTKIFLPLYSLIWANTHGSFPLGITIIGISIIIDWVQEKKGEWKDISIFLFSLLATTLNPYGIRLWHEVFITITQPEIHYILAEWYPSFFVPYLPMWILIFIATALFIEYRKKFTLWEKVIWIFLLLLGIQSIRNIPYWIIFSLPMTCKSIELLSEEGKKLAKKRLKKATQIGIFFTCIVSIIQGYFVYMQPAYPENASIYLKRHKIKLNLFTDFNWGGYILWKMPQEKIFIDGQMSNWQQNRNKKNESNNAFREFYLVANRAESIEYLSKKYHIRTLLLTNTPFSSWQQQDINLFNVKNHQIYPAIKDQLKAGGWHIIYKDTIAIIYQKQ